MNLILFIQYLFARIVLIMKLDGIFWFSSEIKSLVYAKCVNQVNIIVFLYDENEEK